jgi:hypothetical protein
MGRLTRRIGRSVIAAAAAELLAILLLLIGVFVFVVLPEPLSFGQGERLAHETAEWMIPLVGVVPCFFAGWWAARKLEAAAAQQGVSVGIMAAILDIAFLAWLGAPFGLLPVIAAISRVGGGALGGHVASRRASEEATSGLRTR